MDRGPQYFGYDFAWHLGYDIAVTSEWGTPNMVENGVNPELLLAGQVRTQSSLLGSPQAAAHSDFGSRCRTADGA